jgi:hypothetical protein
MEVPKQFVFIRYQNRKPEKAPSEMPLPRGQTVRDQGTEGREGQRQPAQGHESRDLRAPVKHEPVLHLRQDYHQHDERKLCGQDRNHGGQRRHPTPIFQYKWMQVSYELCPIFKIIFLSVTIPGT